MKELNLGHTEARPVKVLTPYTFSIEDTTLYTPYSGTKGYFQQVRFKGTEKLHWKGSSIVCEAAAAELALSMCVCFVCVSR